MSCNHLACNTDSIEVALGRVNKILGKPQIRSKRLCSDRRVCSLFPSCSRSGGTSRSREGRLELLLLEQRVGTRL